MEDNFKNIDNLFPEEVWNTIKDFFTYELIRFGENDKAIVITTGLIVMLFLSLFITKFLLRFLYKLMTKRLNEEEKLRFTGVFNFARYFIYFFVAISILSSSGIDLRILLTAATVLFVGLGLAMRELFQDTIGGLYIIMDKSVLTGDIIEINGETGCVIDIKLRTTRVLTRQEKVIVVPNHKFITSIIYNYTQNSKRVRDSIRIGVNHSSDVTLVRYLLIKAAKQQPEVLQDPEPFVMLQEFGDFALYFTVHFYIVDSFIEPLIKSEIRFRILQYLRENNIEIAIPKSAVFLNQGS